jgi:hypothetical protein
VERLDGHLLVLQRMGAFNRPSDGRTGSFWRSSTRRT